MRFFDALSPFAMASWRACLFFFLIRLFGSMQFSAAVPSSSSKTLQATTLPLIIPPSQFWDGNDGPWSSFFFGVGSPLQTVRVLISTASNQLLAVLPEGCHLDDPPDCADSRGGTFQSESSSTWNPNNVTAEELSFPGIGLNVSYGSETIALGYVGSGIPALEAQIVGGITSKDLFMGVFGVNPASTNLFSSDRPTQSYMTNLKNQKQIPSLSYGYTAGNKYRTNTSFASLILGGYDASLFVPNNLTFHINEQSSSELMVNVNAITISSREGGIRGLKSATFPALIDSTVPYLSLPIEICRQFEEAFGLTYDYDSELYLVDDALHTKLVQQAADVAFTLKNMTSAMDMNIILPYAAFDLVAKWPLVQNTTRYFPLKREFDNSQTILGRAFLQEAYLIADYERSQFSIHQMKWDSNADGDMRAILPLSGTTAATQKRRNFPTAVIVAICVGGALFPTVLVSCIIIVSQRRQKIRITETLTLKVNSSSRSLEGPMLPHSVITLKSERETREVQQTSPEISLTPLENTTKRVRAYEPGDAHELPARESVPGDVVGSPVEVMLQQTIDSILEQHYRERKEGGGSDS
ncbi:hypothetical protein VTL71DRAFT_12146 [Oculimacula yallundae]|uniref:Peptidase A1 domain-containing protein n=1 Tax=Oculimacula yallundae TaxID=86028 RepID=A0ABR4CTV9_9HELO